jgi:hypothetical protein
MTCDDHPCLNNAKKCQIIAHGKLLCVCDPAYTGDFCETKKKITCADSPCKNNGICSAHGNDFQCACPSSWNGPTCETSTQSCAFQSTLCKSPGTSTCVDVVNHYQCQCNDGYYGQHCDQTVKCTGNKKDTPCVNGGVCVKQTGGKPDKCSCPVGYNGTICDISVTNATLSTSSAGSALRSVIGFLMFMILVSCICGYGMTAYPSSTTIYVSEESQRLLSSTNGKPLVQMSVTQGKRSGNKKNRV